MISLFWYLMAGVSIYLVTYSIERINQGAQPSQEQSLSKIMETLLKPETRTRKGLSLVAESLIFCCVIIPFWPVFILNMVREKLFNNHLTEDKTFEVMTNDLLLEMDINKIESIERVIDPMTAVPNTPFGHLHTAWLKFKTQIEPLDQVYSFSALWTKNRSGNELYCGYVIVRADEIGPYFVTNLQTIDNDAKALKIFSR